MRPYLFFVLSCLALSQLASGSASLCGVNADCVCVMWTTNEGGWFEMRCPGGANWTTDPLEPLPGNPNGGSWGGTGQPPSPPAQTPGSPLNATVANAVEAARLDAIAEARRERWCDEFDCYWLNTECSELFGGSPLGLTGGQLLGSYITFRSGEGYMDPVSQSYPCTANSQWAAFAFNTSHSPYVMICDRFMDLSENDRTAILLHEALHVGGQLEGLGGTGPGQAPTSEEITDRIKQACGL